MYKIIEWYMRIFFLLKKPLETIDNLFDLVVEIIFKDAAPIGYIVIYLLARSCWIFIRFWR